MPQLEMKDGTTKLQADEFYVVSVSDVSVEKDKFDPEEKRYKLVFNFVTTDEIDGALQYIRFYRTSNFIPSADRDFSDISKLGKVAKGFQVDTLLREKFPRFAIETEEELEKIEEDIKKDIDIKKSQV